MARKVGWLLTHECEMGCLFHAYSHDELRLCRLIMDQRQQRKGYGKRVLDLASEQVRLGGKANRLLSSYTAGSD